MKSHLHFIRDWDDLAQKANYRSSQLARLCGISHRQLERFFTQQVACSPQKWLDQQRLRRAEALLQTGRFVKEVAFELGFKDCSHFCRRFKAEHGQSPLAFVAGEEANVARIPGMSLPSQPPLLAQL